MTAQDDINTIAPVPEEFRLSTGTYVSVERLKTRQFFRLLKILTRGAGPMLMEYRLDSDLNPDEFAGRMLALTLLSVPEAEDEAIDFLRSMTKPVGLIEGRGLGKGDRERNEALWADLEADLQNPELEDTVALIERIVRNEAKDVQGLGKRLQGMFQTAQKTGQYRPEEQSLQTQPSTASTPPASSAPSGEPSTS